VAQEEKDKNIVKDEFKDSFKSENIQRFKEEEKMSISEII